MTETTGATVPTAYTVCELLVLTKADAEGLLADLDAIGNAAVGEQPQLVEVLCDHLNDRAWKARADRLADALDRSTEIRSSSHLATAWTVHNDIANLAALPADAGLRTAGPAQVDARLRSTLAAVVSLSEEVIADDAGRTQYETAKKLLWGLLEKMKVGASLDANAALARTVPDAAARQAILQRLHADSQFHGAVAVSLGLIYRLRADRWRYLTYWAPVICFLLAGGILIGVSELHSVFGSGYPTQLWGVVSKPHHPPRLSWHKLLGPYLLVVAGVVAHLTAENLKQGDAGVPILATNDLLEWLSLRWLGLAESFLPVVVVVIGLSVLNIGAQGHDLALWIAAGYSVDSIAGLLLKRFDTGSLAETLKKVVPPGTAPG